MAHPTYNSERSNWRTIVGNRSRLDLVRRKVALWNDGKQWRLRLSIGNTNRRRFTVFGEERQKPSGTVAATEKFHSPATKNSCPLMHTIRCSQFRGPHGALFVLSLLGLHNRFRGTHAEVRSECRVSCATR